MELFRPIQLLRLKLSAIVGFCVLNLFAMSGTPVNAQGVDRGTFHYMDDHGHRRIAHIEDAWGNFISTHDPRWSGSEADGSQAGSEWEWLTYRGWDGGVWLTKIHLYSVDDKSFKWDFESKHPGEGNGHNGTFGFIGWDGVHYEITKLTFGPLDGHKHKPISFVIESR